MAAALAEALEAGDIVLLEGELGTGKTTFVRGACRALGVKGRVASPSFTIGRMHFGRIPVAHVDLFRLDTLAGEDPALLDDYLGSGMVTFIEWPSQIASLIELGSVAVRLRIEHRGGDKRAIFAFGRADLVRRLRAVLDAQPQ